MDQSETDDSTPSRRGLLAKAAVAAPLVAVGSGLVSLSRFLPDAWGQSGPTDYDLAGFATTVELAIVDLYNMAAPTLSGQQATVVASFGAHHSQYVDAFSGFFTAATAAAPSVANAKLVSDFSGQVTAGGNSTLTALAQLEELAAATWFWVLGQFDNAAGAKNFASIMAVEGQHAVTLGLLSGAKPTDLVPDLQTDAKKITPSDHPITAAAGASGTSGAS